MAARKEKMTRRNRPVELTDAPEHRSIPLDRVELRANEDDNDYILTGYASTFEEYEMYGGPSQYGWIERIDPDAFEKTLREKPDLHLLVNHAGMPLARTKSGTLSLSTDHHGLRVEARLDKRDPEVQSLAVKMERGDMDEMSFAFRVKAQEWRAAPGYEEIDDQSYRTITEVSLHKGDVSVVNWGANPTTSVGIRSASDILRELVEIDDIAELRAEEELVKLAKAKIEELAKPVEVDEERDEETAEVAEERETEAAAPSIVIENVSTSVRFAEIVKELNEDAELLKAFRELILGAEERDEEEVEDSVEETVEETEIEIEPEPRGMSLTDALAVEGILPDGEARLSLDAALALSE